MNITSRSRYAIKVMMDLALHQDRHHVTRRDIAARQGISPDYLDQIMIRLRRGGLVESIRGRAGGYRLARDSASISSWQIFYAVEDSLFPVECVDDESACAFEISCIARSAWENIFSGVRSHLEKTSLKSLISSKSKANEMSPADGIRHCGGGGVSHPELKEIIA